MANFTWFCLQPSSSPAALLVSIIDAIVTFFGTVALSHHNQISSLCLEVLKIWIALGVAEVWIVQNCAVIYQFEIGPCSLIGVLLLVIGTFLVSFKLLKASIVPTADDSAFIADFVNYVQWLFDVFFGFIMHFVQFFSFKLPLRPRQSENRDRLMENGQERASQNRETFMENRVETVEAQGSGFEDIALHCKAPPPY
ncbi:hypothetical protein C8J56DRAFT_905812 [Mycena floridula]|nr:hypothetical protein C8J56DRAFT_905812 [Mycena floridula]